MWEHVFCVCIISFFSSDITAKEVWSTDNTLGTEIEMNDPARGLKLVTEGAFNPQSGSVTIFYEQKHKTGHFWQFISISILSKLRLLRKCLWYFRTVLERRAAKSSQTTSANISTPRAISTSIWTVQFYTAQQLQSKNYSAKCTPKWSAYKIIFYWCTYLI